jgi:hypothetical protein
MKEIRPGLHGNFLSLDRAVRAVASRVKISDEEVDARLGLNRIDKNEFQTTLDRTAIRSVLGPARAAGILFRHLSQPSPARPNWQDSAIGGFPIVDDGVSREGLEILARWARSEAEFRLQGGPWSEHGGRVPCMEVLPGPSRLMQIGFDVDDLIHFLNASGVDHSLGEPLNDSSMPSAMNPGGNSNTASARSTRGRSGRSLPSFKFRGPLSEVLLMAVERAVDPRRYQSAFEALREIARPDSRPIPLLGYNESDDEVLWNNGDRDHPATFTVKDMKSRYRSMKPKSV